MKMPRRREKILRPVRPSAGLAAIYRKRIEALIEDMAASIEWWLTAAYRKARPIAMDEAPPEIAAVYVGGSERPWAALIDGEPMKSAGGTPLRFATEANAAAAARRAVGALLPADQIKAVMDDLAAMWLDKFDVAANRLARFFGRSVAKRTETQLRNILRDGGFSVPFRVSPAVMDATQAAIYENVRLIKSIPEKYLSDVESLVMRSVAVGRDVGTLQNELQERYKLTKKRAALIARDQNNKATSVIQEARRKELGIVEAVWMHSHAGKRPRPTHVAMDGKRYRVDEGMFDSAEGRNVFPGELINCRCVSRSIVPGAL